ncbi:MAG TPA: ABC transporter substrate binding protein, partial [Candidatus Ozemobacteraceae bacterium]|nr:ABC transporter substrate binding protein [Candidatus Ozemobacteraceae bacterium]
NNITGNCYRVTVAEQISIALEPLTGKLSRLGAVYKSGELTSEIALDEARKLAAQQGFELISFDARTPSDLAAAADLFKQHQVQAVFLSSDSVIAASDEIALRPIVTAFPTVCALESTIRRGGLVGRVADWNELCRHGAQIGIEILEGAQPSTIPIGRTPAARTILNTETAGRLGIKVPNGFAEQASMVDQGSSRSKK